ncbi:uncharacterized protein LOC113753273 [Coffea eugenioides]|uniref:uncharacterized protein LOC113753273 n=1 Tax=Coffea eugenioides TaxID=49369 RepID=UPI000F612802|nr:uncharacterized protein LOC113753273 [Coffea eugenioides]XP_027153182.1 uncharacterized protein LOC113753273 [Coffea eugenioides]XP_027153183.1 uncharacterized protein LOC113753273 [Coffea eugenioides]
MAEEIVNSLVASEISESDDISSHKSSISKPSSPDNAGSILPSINRTSPDSCPDFNDSRRNSTGKRSNTKVVPHYLRASTGSCHDFCKYGHKHAFEEKEMHPFRKGIIRTPIEKQNSALTASLVERKKVTVMRRMVSPGMKFHSSRHGSSPGPINLADRPTMIKQLPAKKVEVSPKCDPLPQHKESKSEKRMNNFSSKHPPLQPPPTKQFSSLRTLKSAKQVVKDEKPMSNFSLQSSPSVGPRPSAKNAEKAEKLRNNLSEKSSPSVGEQQPVSKSSSCFHPPASVKGRDKRKDDMKASRNLVVTKVSAKKVFAAPTALLSPKPSMNINVAMKAKKNRTLKVVCPLKDQNRVQGEEMEKNNDEIVSEKTLHVIVEEKKNHMAEFTENSDVVPSFALQSVPSPKSLSRSPSPSLSSHERRGGVDGGCSGDGDGTGDSESLSSHERRGENDDGDGDGDSVEEEEEGGGGEFGTYDDDDDEGEDVEEGNGYACETTGKFCNKNDMAKHNGGEAGEGNLRKTLRKGVVFSESKDPRPVKLKFKRGKVVDLQSENNGGPRRLRFRRPRVMEEKHDVKGELRRRNFKKKEPDGDGNGSKPRNENVVLKHQDMQGRKDAQGLFNNVIEETANKLVESRKSKVKALVGAFETVISLQDTKPSPQTVS